MGLFRGFGRPVPVGKALDRPLILPQRSSQLKNGRYNSRPAIKRLTWCADTDRFHRRSLASRELAYFFAWPFAVRSQLQEFTHLLYRESEFPRAPDKA
jgi:hypothetical protein